MGLSLELFSLAGLTFPPRWQFVTIVTRGYLFPSEVLLVKLSEF